MSAVIKPGGAAAREQAIRALLAEVADPEIPVLSIVDLGIVRHVRFEADGRLHVGITPTYSGCPATEVIRTAVKGMLPKNRLARRQLNKLKVYAGPDHPHEAQAPQPLQVVR